MFSIVKIYGGELQNDETCSFDFTTKSYYRVFGLIITGSAEVSLIFDKESRLFLNSMDIETTKSTKPNRRAFMFVKDIKEDFIKGTIKKLDRAGKVSVYLFIK